MTEELYQKYREAAKLFLNRYGITCSEHIETVIVSLLLTRDKVWVGGDFVVSICENDLHDAVRRADSDCINHLKTFSLAYHNCFL